MGEVGVDVAGTKNGSKKRIKTTIAKYGNDFFAKIGKIGGSKGWADSGVVKGPKKKKRSIPLR